MTGRVLVVSPHPDDEALGCGGTLHRHSEEGDEVRVVFLTSGEHGGHDLSATEAGPQREKEARRAAEILGIGRLDFWREHDGRLRSSGATIGRLRDLVLAWAPGIVYTPHPAEMHPDHRAAARIALAAVKGLPTSIRLFEVWTPVQRMDEIVDITSHVDAKVAAVRAYESQCRVLPFDEAFLGLARYRGEMFSWPEGRYAEVFARGIT